LSPLAFNKTDAGLKPWQQLLVFALVAAAIVSRRPDALFNPQFYAEDGAVWYAQAYNLGWLRSLAIPAGGYLNTLPRVLCGAAVLVPLATAPLLLNLFGIAIQALPVTVLLSSRCAGWGTLPIRALQALIYLALPNSSECDVTVTNAHWHLALVLCLIVFGTRPPTFAWKVFDVAALLLGGLTGPWAIVLAPLAFLFWRIRRQTWSLVTSIILAVCALVQMAFLATSYTRPATPLGASPDLLLRLITGQIYVAAIWGQNSFVTRGHILFIALVFVASTAVIVYCFLKSGWEHRLFIVFCALILAASLASPLIAGPLPRWQLLTIDKGGRYWFFPMLALLWSLLWWATRRNAFSIVVLAVSLRGSWHDWHYWPYKNENFPVYAAQFERAKPGTKMTIPIYPDGHQMELIRK
jgi:hypothetical protein